MKLMPVKQTSDLKGYIYIYIYIAKDVDPLSDENFICRQCFSNCIIYRSIS